jgi:rubrerythrin
MSDVPNVSIGTEVYNDDGERLGNVRGFEEHGFYVSTEAGIESLSIEHERAGHEFGQAELTWRCANCGAMGDIAELPETCPDCGAPREDIYYWTED